MDIGNPFESLVTVACMYHIIFMCYIFGTAVLFTDADLNRILQVFAGDVGYTLRHSGGKEQGTPFSYNFV